MNISNHVSVVMCTYNGASRHLAEQLDSILSQTILPMEIVVQDDGSTDNTLDVLHAYEQRMPEGVALRIYSNPQQLGINANFFSAMRKAKGELIAVSDQDDIWLPTKIEDQQAAIGNNMMCVCRSVPFSDGGDPISFDPRRPNCCLARLFYASMMGHCQMLRRELLDVIPTQEECPEIYRRTCYDVLTATAAAALDSIVLIDRQLVRQRRYAAAATYVRPDQLRTRSSHNAAAMLLYGMRHYFVVKPWMRTHFDARRQLLQWVKQKAASNHIAAANGKVLADGMQLLNAECSKAPLALARLTWQYIKHRHTIFYTHESDPVAFVRALMHPFMQIYNYRYLVGKTY